jgi:two-component system, NtrC family, response regulator HydG
MSKGKILIVEDQFIEANNLHMILERAGYAVSGIARSVSIALKMLESELPDMVLLDIYLQGNQTGIDLAGILKERGIAFIYLSANSNKETLDAAKATRPYGFLVKPFREKDVLAMMEIANYLHKNRFEQEPVSGNKQSPGKTKVVTGTRDLEGIIGESDVLKTVLQQLRLVAPTDTSVLILGETGTGKERIAELIHEFSGRNKKPLVKVNCAALPANLVESILFGHERGSFTGATEKRIGKFEHAGSGTIFLDEVGELALEIQSKLLRVLQQKEIERLGGNETIPVDVRIIAATNRNLEKEVAEGRFRMDLYYRLNVFPLVMPPLRERKKDIPLLTKYFAELYSKKLGKQSCTVDDSVIKELVDYHWPGNIRELEHIIERAVLLAQGNLITKLPMTMTSPAVGEQDRKIKTMEENEKEYIVDVLKKCNGKIFGKGGAAEMMNVNPSTLNSRIKKLGINKTPVIS